MQVHQGLRLGIRIVDLLEVRDMTNVVQSFANHLGQIRCIIMVFIVHRHCDAQISSREGTTPRDVLDFTQSITKCCENRDVLESRIVGIE